VEIFSRACVQKKRYLSGFLQNLMFAFGDQEGPMFYVARCFLQKGHTLFHAILVCSALYTSGLSSFMKPWSQFSYLWNSRAGRFCSFNLFSNLFAVSGSRESLHAVFGSKVKLHWQFDFREVKLFHFRSTIEDHSAVQVLHFSKTVECQISSHRESQH